MEIWTHAVYMSCMSQNFRFYAYRIYTLETLERKEERLDQTFANAPGTNALVSAGGQNTQKPPPGL